MNQKVKEKISKLKEECKKAAAEKNIRKATLYSDRLFYYMEALKDAEVITKSQYDEIYTEIRKEFAEH